MNGATISVLRRVITPRVDRRRESNAVSFGNTTLENDGVYWTTIHIGSPVAEAFTVMVDTGSATLSVPCVGCDSSCGEGRPGFNSSASATVVDLGQKYKVCYSEMSCAEGMLLEDVVGLGAGRERIVRQEFGCCERYTGAMRDQEADGMMGLSGYAPSFIRTVFDSGNLDANVFSLCLGKTPGGFLSVGGLSENMNLEPLQWLTNFDMSGKYHVRTKSIGIGQYFKEVRVDRDALLDSGTTFTFVPTDIREKLLREMRKWCDSTDGRCQGVRFDSDELMCVDTIHNEEGDPTRERFETFPNIQFKVRSSSSLETATMCLPPVQYFTETWREGESSERRTYCAVR